MCRASTHSAQTSEDEDDIEYLRGKWIFEGATTLEEVIEMLEKETDRIRSLKTQGWELVGAVTDDYGRIKQNS